jgi:hypothetical protein
MDRRHFIQSASLLGAAAGSLVAGAPPAQALAQGNVNGETARPMTRRWVEQRWVLDNVIQANGVDWDQPRTSYWNAPCGMEASADFAAIRQRVKKFADISTEFEAQARRREQRANAAEQTRDVVTARGNYFIAAVHWGAAQWPIQEANEQNRRYNQRKRECFTKYAKFADHQVTPVWISVGAKSLPAWFHLPVGYSGGRVPAVVAIPGMDS